ncbi:splicing regulator ARVCF-like isoform X1 [Argiope bruennichi]|uniref:Catenin delta-2 like protein n=1 Tax=Argiope bruennichi TaxID=94029 RepID=A0A8T0F3Z2_ARGBR|nr:splicing regulator ARVCF-like isoform X1 [Argiope bruennichi]KAF8785904.1 Catenin delta-2 like protein [Argiope bruennichi]
MPSGQEEALLQHDNYPNPDHKASILQAVKDQEAQFQQLSRDLDAERQSVTSHLERYKIRDPEDGSATYTENPYIWRPTQIDSVIPEDSEFDPKMSESHLHYYPDGSTLPDYLQEGIPQVQESYTHTIGYETSTSTNGHGDGDASSNNSKSSVPVDNASFISRSTSQTQQVKTITKIVKTREVHHIGPDGKPYSYGGALPPGGEYIPYNYPNPSNVPHDYGTYDPGRPPSPAGQTPTQVYPLGDYGTYGRTASPVSAARNFDLYSQAGGQPYSEYGYREYPPQSVTTPSGDSPNLHRAMPQAPRVVATDYNQPGNYEDIDASGLVPPRMDYRTPSPTQSADRYGTPYGYAGQPLPATSPGYHQYDAGLPQGHLDRRPSYDDYPSQGPQHQNSAYARAPRAAGYEEEEPPVPLSVNESSHPPAHSIPPRHPHLEYAPVDSEGGDVRWRDPDLHEVIEFLGHPNNVVRANAAAYLTHLIYSDDNMKQKTRSLGGIPPIIDLLSQDVPEIQRNACAALRNLSYGRQNDENKRAIRNADGIPALVKLLKKTQDSEIKELVTGILWNLSSCEDLKRPIIDDALTVLVNHVIIPHSGYDRTKNPLDPVKPHDLYWSTVFRNASGVLRNISSAGETARKKLRTCDGLIESMVYLVRAAIGKNDMDNKSVENCVCVLRNLSYRCQEVEDPDYDKHLFPPVQSRASAPIRAVGENLGCFGAKKKKEAAQALSAEKERREGVPLTKNPISQSEPVRGMALLWQPEVVQSYLSLLSECSNPETLEAAAGAIQNLAACYWQPSIDIRASVRKDKGLPILVELLRMEVDRVVCAVATSLRNLAVDPRNGALIGNYAMKDLVLKLPNGSPQHDSGTSDDTIAAVLATLNEVVAKQSDFARSLLSLGGVERLHQITQQKNNYSPRVVKFASQLLYNMWQHQELREAYRKAGWKESHFVPKSSAVRNSLSSPTSANSTLNRPVSTQGGTKYEDRTLPHGTELNSSSAAIPYSRSEELPLSELSHSTEPPPSSQIHRPHMGVYPPGMQQARSPTEPVYAQVNRERKKDKRDGVRRHSDKKISVQLLANDQSDGMPAGDSWV